MIESRDCALKNHFWLDLASVILEFQLSHGHFGGDGLILDCLERSKYHLLSVLGIRDAYLKLSLSISRTRKT